MTGGPGARPARVALLATVFLCAACGLVYELALVALGSYLIGDTVGQASIVLSLMVFAMGIGALVAKPLQRRAAVSFALIELVLALLGGLSVLLLYAAFAWLSLYTPALIAMALILGVLIGAEIPLLMELLQRIRAQAAGSAVADLFAADYVGALLGGLAFPFVLLPVFGQIEGAIVVGVVNALAGLGLVLTVFRREIGRRGKALLFGGAVVVFGVLGAAYVLAEDFEVTARQALYADPIVHSERTPYQDIVITESVSLSGNRDVRLFLNGDLQFSSVDEYRYHEALVHPAMAGPHANVLVLGGGDGLALREVLRYPDVEAVTLVELDPAMIALARTEPRLLAANGNAFADPRVTVRTEDAFSWLRSLRADFDVIIVDMPDPDSTATAKLYSVEFYGLVAQALGDGGRVVVQAGSPFFAPHAFWCVAESLREAGLASVPYQVSVPAFGEWGFHLAGRGTPALTLPDLPLRSLDRSSLAAAAVFPPDRRAPADVRASTLMDPVVLRYSRQEWTNY
ncbi:polyamine aminopropyltransferase [Actinokineospora soli]